jgi:hypothetical protein
MTKELEELKSFGESLNELRREKGKNPQPDDPTELPVGDIRFAHLVFQPRSFEGNRADSEDHIRTLMAAIRDTPGHILDPITVWWSGTRWLVIDGHHRMVAYGRLRTDKDKPLVVSTLPVVVFKGTLQEAITEAVRMNSRDKLNMSKAEKLERAWKLTVMDHPSEGTMSRAEVAKATGVSEPTISNMRKELRSLLEKKPTANPVELSWDDVKRGQKQAIDRDEKWLDKQAKEWAKRLAKTFGKKMAVNPAITARAIEMYSEKLPVRLLESWREEVEAMADAWDKDEF